MKRSAPPPRKTPLKRTAIQQKQRKPIPKRSTKQRALYEKRRPFVVRILRERPVCEGCALFAWWDGRNTFVRRSSSEVHEIIRRGQGGDILDEANVASLCHDCHERCTNGDPKITEQLGLTLPSWARKSMEIEAKMRRSMEGHLYMTRPSWHEDWLDDLACETEYYRAGSDAECLQCGREYWRHPCDADLDWLRVLCNGDRVKL